MSQRFSDAELAAEMWRSKAYAATREINGYSPGPRMQEAETFWRFATLPHAHDVEWCTCEHPADEHNCWWCKVPACTCHIDNSHG